MNVDDTSRISFATFSSSNDGGKTVISHSAAVSLSKAEAMELGKAKNDNEIASIKLACFWKRIGKNQFCLPDGGVVKSTTTLLEYYTAAKPHYTAKLNTLADQHIYTICYREAIIVPLAKKAGDVPLDLSLHTFENPARELDKLPDAPAIDPNAIASAAIAPGSRPGDMSTDNWNEVVVVNNLLNGFCIDRISQTISKARKTAFKLEPNPVHPLMFSPGTLPSAGIADLRKRAKAAADVSPLKSIERGLKSAFLSPPSKLKTAAETPSITSSDNEAQEGGSPTPPAAEPLEHLYPLWEVCDDSSVKIETISTTLQHASTQQGFSSASVEAAISTSVISVAADASAGFATSSNTASSTETGNKSEQMHASYEFPRVRLYLDEDSISLSSDCAAAITKITSTKSYQALMDFYRDYGHLFVTRVKLGGRLRATRFLSADEAKTMGSTQNAWKASLAASFSSVTTSGSVKATAESATSSEQRSASTALNDSVCWEAHGGNTTLANNPSAWCNTVENFWYWRIVDQEVVLPIEGVISKLKGFESTRSIFTGIIIDAMFQATPKEIQWNGADGVGLGRGISATGEVKKPMDVLRDSALKAGEVKTVSVPAESDFQWSVISNNSTLYRFLVDVFRQTINPYVGTKLVPSLVWRLGLSDRAFSIILRIRNGLEKATTTFTIADGTQPTDQQEWKNKFGDFFINSIVSGNATTVIWTFVPQTPSTEQFRTKSAVANFFAAPLSSFEIGCAYMARLAMDIPCEAYMYDAYYNETKIIPPSHVVSAIAQRNLHGAKQVLSVGLESYRDLDFLQSAAGLTTSSGVSLSALATVQRDQSEYAFQSIKRRPDTTPIATPNDLWNSWSTDFSPAAYSDSLTDPAGKHAAATGLATDYNTLFNKRPTTIEPRMEGWDEKYGDEGALERLLRWLRLSRQAEAKQLSLQSKQNGATVFGLKDEPALTNADMVPGRARGKITIYSLRDEFKRMKFEAILVSSSKNANSLDGMWSYVTDENLKQMKFPKPGRVVAYELTTTSWDGKGEAPAMTSDGKVLPRVGEDIKSFAEHRNATKTDGWILTNLWIAFAPFKWEEIYGLEEIAWP